MHRAVQRTCSAEFSEEYSKAHKELWPSFSRSWLRIVTKSRQPFNGAYVTKYKYITFCCWGGLPFRGKIKAICGDLGHCSLLFKSDPNAVYLPPNAVYWLQGSFQRSTLLPLLSFAASPPFKPEINNTSLVFQFLNCQHVKVSFLKSLSPFQT